MRTEKIDRDSLKSISNNVLEIEVSYSSFNIEVYYSSFNLLYNKRTTQN
ncbi:Uncharacterised protein [Streptococcus pneumoniae]|nr:Uncharacterised protein [Streptococcus pneumoniae]